MVAFIDASDDEVADEEAEFAEATHSDVDANDDRPD